MKTSKYTFLAKKYKSGDIMAVNYLSGSIDLIEKDEASEFQERFSSGSWEDYHLRDYLLERGYIYRNEVEEEEKIRERYLEFSDEYEKTPVQLIFSTSFVCNFACKYCFQEEYQNSKKMLDFEITDSFFSHINKQFAEENVRPYITVFGGEPLLGAENYRKSILYFLENSVKYNYPVAIVTNGYELSSYVPEFVKRKINIREIQVTVDGDREHHNERRILKGGKTTFDRIMDGIDDALRAGYRINLRSIIDRENIESLPKLAEYCQERGFLDYPSSQFETTIGRNYELHTCQKTDKLFDRFNIWEKFFELSEKYPILKKYHKPQFHGMRYLAENGSLPFPVFDGCPAGKKEWAFDIHGYIYGCTASVGVEKFRLGSYVDPSFPADAAQLLEWKTRDVLTVPECRECAVSLSCGGGCGVLAANYGGKIHGPNCRPVAELVGIGADYYDIG